EKQQTLADEAAAHLEAGRLISPREGNAYESYQALLALRANSTQAQQGLARIERTLIANIEQLINTEQLEEATLLLASARDRYPQSQALFSLRLSLDQAQEVASKPQVVKARVAAAALMGFDGGQAEVLNPDRIIYLGFAYANFPGQTTVVQAVLFDGSRSVRIAQ